MRLTARYDEVPRSQPCAVEALATNEVGNQT